MKTQDGQPARGSPRAAAGGPTANGSPGRRAEPGVAVQPWPAPDSASLPLAGGTPALLWQAGKDGVCTGFSQGWLDFAGRSLAQELGNGWTAGVHPVDVQGCLDTYLAALRARHRFQFRVCTVLGA